MTKFAVFKKEKGINDFSELAAELFNIKGRGAAETAKKAGAALLEANPHLRDLTKAAEGALIVIPDLPDYPTVRESETVGVATEIDKQLNLAIQAMDDMIGQSAASEEQAAAVISEALKSRELQDFASQSDKLKQRLKDIGGAAKTRLKVATASAAAEKGARAQLQQALEKWTQ